MPHLLFDLDGTLVDPAEGIIESFQLGLQAVGAPVPAATDLGYVIGPPLRTSFPMAGVAVGDVETALAAYRQNYRAGAMFRAAPYPGIADAVAALRERGYTLHVATSKPHVFARPILEHFDLARHFASIHGAELDGTRDAKADVIAHLLASQTVDARRAIMIGDTRFDVEGAAAHGIATIGVAWGHGGHAQLADAGATIIIRSADQLLPTIDRLAAERALR